MSDTYTKLFSSITESTVWGEPYATRVVWVAMLAMADARGNVYGSLPGLARRANVTLEEVERALGSFRAPDPYSRTQDEDGRRVDSIDGGWHLINHGKYGAVRNAEERREYKREWDRRHRSKAAKEVDTTDTSSDESDTTPTKPISRTPPALTPTLEDQKPPCSPPVGDKPKVAAKAGRTKAITLATYLADCEASGREPIPDADAVWQSAEAAGLPREWIALAWWAFQGRYLANPGDKAKIYASWPQAFRNSVRENWLKLWWPTEDGGYRLSPAGQQARREMEHAA